MRPLPVPFRLLALAPLALLLAVPPAAAARQDAAAAPRLADLLGADLPLVLTIVEGGALVDAALDSGLRARLEELPEWRQALDKPGVKKARAALAMFSGLLGRPARDGVGELLGREIVAGAAPRDQGTPAVVLLLRARSADAARRIGEACHAFLTLVAADESAEEPGPIRTVNGKEFHAVVDDLFVAGNERALVEQVLALARQGLQASAAQATPGVHLDLDLDLLRRTAAGARLPEVLDNALAAILGQGLLAAVNQSSRASAEIQPVAGGVGLTVELDAAAAALSERFSWFFPEAAPARPLAPPAGTIATLEVARAFDEFYARRFELLADEIEGQLLEFDNIASIFFGGRAFGEEVLPALGDRITLVVGSQTYAGLEAPPAVQIPAFSLVAPFDAAVLGGDDLLMAFQTTIGLVNADRAQKGLASMMLATERVGEVEVASARFLAEMGGNTSDVRFNATPALAVLDGVLVLSSAREHALALVAALGDEQAAERPARHTRLAVDFAALKSVLAANQESLVAQRMLEQGESRGAAEEFWSRLLLLLGALDSLDLTIDPEPAGLRAALTVTARPALAADEREVRR